MYNNSYFKAVCLTILILVASKTNAQPSIYKWFEKNNISIRKTFDGSKKDEEKPSVLFWGRDFKNDFSYTTIDIGLKINQIEFLKNTKSALLFYPKLEWHKDGSKAGKEKNNLSGGVNMEFFPVPVSAAGGEGWKLVPWLLGSSDYQNDFIKKLKTTKFKGFISLFGTSPGLPGSQIKTEKGSLIFRYYPYSGIENYNSTGNSKNSSNYWANRFFFEFYPITTPLKQYVQITFDYTYRVKLNDHLYNRNNLSWISAGINIYPDGLGKFGIGIDYSNGDDPSDNFTITEKISFGFKLKL